MSYQETIYRADMEGKIKGAIEMAFEYTKSIEDIVEKIIIKFSLTREEAEEYVNKYRPAAN